MVAPLWSEGQPVAAARPAPVSISGAEFVQYAREQNWPEPEEWRHLRDHPEICLLRDDRPRSVDVWSLYERLRASRLETYAWYQGASLKIEFLARLINARLNLDEPLPLARREALRR